MSSPCTRRNKMLARTTAIGLLVMLPRLAAGQQVQTDTPKTQRLPGAIELGLSDSTQRRIAQAMAKDLGNVRKAEASYYAAHKVYAYTVADLAPLKLTNGNIVTIMTTDGGGYRAVATNPALPGAEAEAVVPAPPH
ncbi:MAG TPA: hypothetical protein VK679_20590 [Gemmatimonadaceae bacterium]|nr:hypothetical protein [Gemmatimonadaceae bacterium]